LSDPISGVGDTSAPSIVATTFDYRNTGYMRQRKLFKHEGTYFVFYSDDTNMVYKTSQDGQTWSEAIAVRPCALSARFSIWYDGAYVHYAYNPHDIEPNTPIYYRRGLISTSAIVWDPEQIAVPAGPRGYVYSVVATDSSGHPWIGYLDYTTYYTYVTKSSANDGTWQTASGFPYKLTEILSNGGVSSWGSILVPLTENRVYAVYGRGGGHPLNGRLWTGSNWSQEETASISPLDNNWYAFSAVAFHDDVHVVFISGSNIIHVKRMYGAGWGAEEIVRLEGEGIDIGRLGVSLAIDARNGDMWAFFSNNETSPDGWVKYRRYVASTRAWSQIDFDLASNRNYPFRPSASYQVQESEVCVIWTEKMPPNSNNLVFATTGRPTAAYGYLARDDSTGRIYYIYGGKKYWVTTPEAHLAYGFRPYRPGQQNQWKTATAAELALPDGYALNGDVPLPPLLLANGALMGDTIPGGRVYYVAGGTKYWIETPAAFTSYGFNSDDIIWVPTDHLALYSDGPNLTGGPLPWPPTATQTTVYGYLARDDSTGRIYYIYGGKKYWVTTPEAHLAYGFRPYRPGQQNQWKTATAAELALPDGYALNGDVPLPPLLLANGALMGDTIPGGRVYYVAGGTKYWIETPAAFTSYGFNSDDIIWVPTDHLALYSDGPNLTGGPLPWP